MGRKHNKEDNRFKFQSFSERVSNINVDIFHRVPHRYEVESEKEETYMYQAVEKWNVLNLTEKWINFQKELGKGITTLPELLNNKERIVQIFLKHIRKQTELSLQPILEVLVAFIKDLRHEFYLFYSPILKELVKLLKSDQADVVEWTFTTLSYIFKYLGNKLAKDLDKVIIELAPLLDEKNRDYVRDFAAQSFAFVARKIRERKKFLTLVLHTAQTYPELATGCAQLVFETMRGIKSRVHSSAPETLKIILESFGDDQIPQKLLFFMMGHIIEMYGKTIDVQYSILLDVFIAVLKEKLKDNQIPKGMTKLLKLLCMAIEIKLGAYVTNPKAVIDLLVTIFNLDGASPKVEMVLAMISVDMLRFESLKLPQDATSLLIMKSLQMKDAEAKLFFIEQMSHHSAFETLILPRALQIFSMLDNLNFLLTLTKIVIEKTKDEDDDTDSFSKFKLLLNSSSMPLKDSLMKVFSEPSENILEKSDISICSLILIRHIEPMDAASVVQIVKFIENVLSDFDNDEERKDTSLFAVCTAIETLLYFKEQYFDIEKKLDSQLLLSKLLCHLRDDPSLVTLRALDSFLMLNEKLDWENEKLTQVIDITETWLTSPQKNGRLLALRVLRNLQKLKKDQSRKKLNDIIELCLEAERVPLTLADYREKLRLLDKLKCENLDLDDEDHYKLPLKYLIGVLYSNFQLIWDPVCEIIASYSVKMRHDNFWNVFFPELCKPIPDDKANRTPLNFDKILLKSVKFINKDNRIDYYNHRFLLLKTMKMFPELCERKNRDIVNFYLEFVKDEVLNSITGSNQILNVKQKGLINLNEEEKEVNDDDLGLEGDDEAINEGENKNKESNNDEKKKKQMPTSQSKSQTPKIAKTKWLVILLRLFSKFKNPTQCYRETELRSTFFELLLSGSSSIQKSALECILNYKFQYIEPYQSNLRSLTDDVKFKHEIIRFKIDKETGIVSDAHREELMPIVMRILFKKMTAKTSVKRGNKGGAVALKRSIIFRFLAGCHNSEMEMFLKLAFEPFIDNFEGNSDGLLKTMDSIDLEKVISPKRLRSGLNLIEVVFNHFGSLMSDHLQRFMLGVLLSIGANVAGVFLKRDEMFKGYLQFYKNLKNNCLESITKFFDQFPNFPWTEEEIESVFEIFVWPNLTKLPLEGVYSPTALMKLFSKWAQNPRFFKLFAKYKKGDIDVTPLPFLMKLLLNEKIQSSVVGHIDNILENLLTLEEDEGDEEEEDDEQEVLTKAPLNASYVVDVQEEIISKLNLKGELNYGSKILFPHVGSILTHLLRQLDKSPKKGLNKSEVSILSRVTEMATSTKHGDALMKILMKLLSMRRRLDEEYLLNMVTTVQNLMNIVANPAYYMKNLAVLFGSVEIPEARKILLNALDNMEVRRPELGDSIAIIKNLNAYDKKMVDLPDFEKRLAAFKSIRALLEENKMDVNLGVVVLHNCFYFIRCETDLSLRDNASFCLQEICPKVAHSIKENKSSLKFWIESILSLIKIGMMAEVDNVQSFSISLLGIMARECNEMHPVLRDLSAFTNKADLEVDVFENAQHLQIYRRMKALLKFSSLAKTLKTIPTRRSLIEFILPLATRYLCKEEFIKRNSLIDAAIECIRTVCRLLPWQQYQSLLRLYLTKLRTKIAFQKQLLRVVVVILDAFHFDISQASEQIVFVAKPDENRAEENKVQKLPETNEEEVLEEMIEVDLQNDEKDEEKEAESDVLAMESVVFLTPEAAARVEDTITNVLLEQLYKIIGQKTKADHMHKVNLKSLGDEAEEEEVLRIPLAVTVVKLLQKLPNRMLQTQLPGIFMRLCTYLKSRMESIRLITRETLEKIVDALGPDCLPQLLFEMKTLLTKGFQLHVLVFTVHAIIQSIQSRLRPGDIDKNLETLLEACKTDLFGTVSEEKEVVQIQVKYVEARSTKSYQLLHLMAQYVTESCLTDLLVPIKDVLTASHSHKLIVKCRECLRQIVLGLSANEFISCDNLFIFVYGITSESIPQLLPVVRDESKKSKAKEKPDCYLIPKAPKNKRGVLRNPVKNNAKSNSHVIIEFGFQLLISLLKKEKLQTLSNDSRAYLDPIVPVLSRSLESQHVRVTTLGLQCLSKIFKFDLPSLKDEMASMRTSLFTVLHKYGAAGLSKGDNFDLVLFTFKALSNMIRDLDYHGITVDQLKILLFYAEQDIHDTSKQATAFNLLKVILKRKLNVPELHDLMMKVAALSVTSELDYIRTQARQAVYQYVMDYPFGKETEEVIGFYLAQLDFDNESGRQSTLDMIHSFITHFPLSVLNEQSSVFLISLGARLLNDDSPTCKKLVSAVIKSMILRLEQRSRDKLFEIVTVWLREKKLSHKQLAAQIGGIFVAVEKEDFSKRFKALLPLIQAQFTGESKPGQFVKLKTEDNSDDRSRDNHLFQVLQFLLKICSGCPNFLTDVQYQEHLNMLIETAHSLLCHPHEWIRLASAQFLGYVFSTVPPDSVASVLVGKKSKEKLAFLQESSIHQRIKSLILDHCAQLIPGIEIGEQFIEQISKNLVYFAQVLRKVKLYEPKNSETVQKNEEEEAMPKLNLLWLVKRMRRIVNMEIAQTPGSYALRSAIYKWVGATVSCLTRTELTTCRPLLNCLMSPIVRERQFMEVHPEKEIPIRDIIKEVSSLMRKKVTLEVYSEEAVKIQAKLSEKRAQRRIQRAQEFVINPQRAAKRKIEKQLRRKEAKKSKIDKFRQNKHKGIKRKRKAQDDGDDIF